MYAFITGNVVSEDTNGIVLENNGIGYQINMSATAIIKLKSQQNPVRVFTYLYVKEDEMSLYGFYGESERDMFLKLISVSGVGAKTAIQILSGATVDDLTLSIATADVKAFSKIKGIGKKTAERIVLELRDKVSTLGISVTQNDLTVTSFGGAQEEAEMALIALGFSKAEAHRAVSSVVDKSSAETIIAGALRKLSR